jgi:hypothetical protein
MTGPEAHPASCRMGAVSFPGVKRTVRGADHPPPSSTGFRMGWSHTSASALCLHRPFPSKYHAVEANWWLSIRAVQIFALLRG